MRHKRGFTLAELVIALLLLSILSVVIVSFSLTMSASMINLNGVVDTTDDMTFLKEMAVKWVSHFDSADYSFRADGEKLVAEKKEDSAAQYAMYLSESAAAESNGYALIAEYENWEGTYQTKTVARVMFSLRNVGESLLIKCTFSYLAPQKTGDTEQYENFTFTISTRVSQGG